MSRLLVGSPGSSCGPPVAPLQQPPDCRVGATPFLAASGPWHSSRSSPAAAGLLVLEERTLGEGTGNLINSGRRNGEKRGDTRQRQSGPGNGRSRHSFSTDLFRMGPPRLNERNGLAGCALLMQFRLTDNPILVKGPLSLNSATLRLPSIFDQRPHSCSVGRKAQRLRKHRLVESREARSEV